MQKEKGKSLQVSEIMRKKLTNAKAQNKSQKIMEFTALGEQLYPVVVDVV